MPWRAQADHAWFETEASLCLAYASLAVPHDLPTFYAASTHMTRRPFVVAHDHVPGTTLAFLERALTEQRDHGELPVSAALAIVLPLVDVVRALPPRLLPGTPPRKITMTSSSASTAMIRTSLWRCR